MNPQSMQPEISIDLKKRRKREKIAGNTIIPNYKFQD